MERTTTIVTTLGHRARTLLRAADNLRRRRKSAPDYVLFTLEGSYEELPPPVGPWWQRLLPQEDKSLHTLAAQFEMVAQEPRVRGVVLHLRPLLMPPAHLQTLRGLLLRLRAAGKRVVVWAQGYDSAAFYVASAADEILLQPSGSVSPLGLSREFVFLVDALEKVGVQVDAVQISPYKTGPDMFTQSGMTEQAREMMTWLTDDAFDEFVAAIAAGRGISEGAARALVDQTPCTDLRAKELGAIDAILNEEGLPAYLGRDGGHATLEPWESARKVLQRPPLPASGRYVALIRVEGLIIPGASRRPPNVPLPLPIVFEQMAGDLTVVQAARAALADERAAAVVLFIESPGGSSAASEAMAAALAALAAKKPLVVAMGAVAASGGYYAATPAQWLVAQPGSITGSIGVYMFKGVTAGLLDKLYLGREKITRGKYAGMYDADHPFTDEERAKVWEDIQRTYDVFLERVAASRRMTVEAVDAIARGRVWTGRQALARGLVDELGGLEAALAKARELGGLPADAPWQEVRLGKVPLPPTG